MTFTRGNRRAGRLNGQQVLSIRQRYATGQISQGALAREHGVTVGTIHNIINGYTWQTIPLVEGDAEILHNSALERFAAEELPQASADVIAESQRIMLEKLAAGAAADLEAQAPGQRRALYDDPPPELEDDRFVDRGALERMLGQASAERKAAAGPLEGFEAEAIASADRVDSDKGDSHAKLEDNG